MREQYAEVYRELAARHWWWRARERVVLRELDRLRDRWDRVLDIGCGGGVLFDPLLQRAGHVEGVEPDASMVDPAGPHAGRIHVRPFDESFTARAPYDLILMLDVLEHMDRRAAALTHARSLLAPDGRFVLTVPAHRWLWTHHDVLNEHRLRYTRDSLVREVVAAGLAPLRVRYFFHWAVAGKVVQRVAEAVRTPEATPPRVPSAPINRALEWLSGVDYRVGGALRLPFGTSLLLVAGPDPSTGGG